MFLEYMESFMTLPWSLQANETLNDPPTLFF
jgi:hypothetical protein